MKHNTRCANAKTDRNKCKCRCKGLLHGDKNGYQDLTKDFLKTRIKQIEKVVKRYEVIEQHD